MTYKTKIRILFCQWEKQEPNCLMLCSDHVVSPKQNVQHRPYDQWWHHCLSQSQDTRMMYVESGTSWRGESPRSGFWQGIHIPSSCFVSSVFHYINYLTFLVTTTFLTLDQGRIPWQKVVAQEDLSIASPHPYALRALSLPG